MQMHEVAEVTQVAGAGNANKKIAEGWTLLAVVPNANNVGVAHVAYVLGRREKYAGVAQGPQGEHVSDYDPLADK